MPLNNLLKLSHNRSLILLFSVFIISCAKPTNPTEADNETTKPNVLLILTDDQGYGDLSCHGNPWLKTPNLDELYAQSTRFTDFHVSPSCSPTRAALLTGHYANRTGVWHTVGGRSLIREGESTIAETLDKNGYETAIFGKWHLGDNYPFRPQDKGFNEVLIHGGGGVGQQPDYWNNNYFDDTYFHNGTPEKHEGYCTDVWFENASSFISEKANKNEPFFCYLSTNAPHGPYYVADKYSKKYKGKEGVVNPYYYGMVDNLDQNVGDMMGLLDSLEIADNTIVIFMTDNGVGNGAGLVLEKWDGLAARGYNAGMRGAKISAYEGGHRVPFFIRWPNGGIKAGKDIDELTAHVDIFPTLLEMLSIDNTEDIKFDGTSLWGLISGEKERLPKRTLVTDNQRLENPEKWKDNSVMQDKWRLMNGKELYNIANDPGQQNDLAASYPEKADSLRNDYEKWWESISSVFAEYPAIHIGSEQEPNVVINTMDMHADPGVSEVPWHQKHLRKPKKVTGWYAVNFEQSGKYRFKLYRWPTETNASINAGLEEHPTVEGTNVKPYEAGQSVSIKGHKVSIDDQVMIGDINDGDIYSSLEMEVSAGFHRLRADFIEPDGNEFAAYFVGIEKAD